MGLEEAVEDFSAGGVEGLRVADEELDAASVEDEEGGSGEAADIFFRFEDEVGRTAVGIDLPGAGGGVAGDAFDAPDFWHEFAGGEFIADEGEVRFWEGFKVRDPSEFVAVSGDEGDTFVPCGDGECADGIYVHVFAAVGAGEDELSEGVEVELESSVHGS